MIVKNLDNEINPFPAVPESWSNLIFYNIPAAGGHKVSGEIKEGSVEFFQIIKDSRLIYETTRTGAVKLDQL